MCGFLVQFNFGLYCGYNHLSHRIFVHPDSLCKKSMNGSEDEVWGFVTDSCGRYVSFPGCQPESAICQVSNNKGTVFSLSTIDVV